jgi:hypothetical protein
VRVCEGSVVGRWGDSCSCEKVGEEGAVELGCVGASYDVNSGHLCRGDRSVI